MQKLSQDDDKQQILFANLHHPYEYAHRKTKLSYFQVP